MDNLGVDFSIDYSIVYFCAPVHLLWLELHYSDKLCISVCNKRYDTLATEFTAMTLRCC